MARYGSLTDYEHPRGTLSFISRKLRVPESTIWSVLITFHSRGN